MESFKKRFNFRPEGEMLVGVERESFLCDPLTGKIAPIAPYVLGELNDFARFGYELSACQLEERIGPFCQDEIRKHLLLNEKYLTLAEQKIGFRRLYVGVAPESVPLDIYPDPTGRYQKIIKKMPKNILLAACRVAALHIHIGMPDHETALRAYNGVIKHLDVLIKESNTVERLGIYKIMEPNYTPGFYKDWCDFYQTAKEKGFDLDLRKCWHLIRISKHGTIEFRVFNTTKDIDQVMVWVNRCQELCKEALLA